MQHDLCPNCGAAQWPGTRTCGLCHHPLPLPTASAAAPAAPAPPERWTTATHQPAVVQGTGAPTPPPATPPPLFTGPASRPLPPPASPPSAVPEPPAELTHTTRTTLAITPRMPAPDLSPGATSGSARGTTIAVLSLATTAVLLLAAIGVLLVQRASAASESALDPAVTTIVASNWRSDLAEREEADNSAGAPLGTTTVPSTTTTTTREPEPVAWERWTAPDGTFTVELPYDAEVTEKTADGKVILATSEVSAVDDGVLYVVRWYDLNPDLATAESGRLLDAFLADRYDEERATVTSQEPTRLADRPALTYTVTDTMGAGIRISATLVHAGTRVYELAASAIPRSEPDLDRLEGSFRLNRQA
jgi:hypothetical protein